MPQYDPMFGEPVHLIDKIPVYQMVGRKWPSILACLCACIGAFSAGFVLGYSSPTEDQLHYTYQNRTCGLLPTEQDVSWFSSLITLGAIAGALVGGWSVDFFGRKATIMFVSVPFVGGWLLIAYATAAVMLFSGRILTGIALGCSTVCIPLYIAEIASKNLRGTLGASFQLWIVFGILVTFALGIPLNYVWLAISGVAVTAALVLAMFFMPESPRWLLRMEKKDEALVAMTWLLGPSLAVDEELAEIRANLDKQEPMSFKELGNRGILKPLFVSLCLMFFQQCGGVNAVMFNVKEIFHNAGFQDSNTPSVIVAAVQVAATGLSVLLIDRLGRRILLFASGTIMTLSCVGFGVYDFYQKTMNLTPLALGSIIAYMVGFSVGWGPIPWLVMSEIFPVRARGIASGIATLCNWTFAFIVTNQFTNLENAIHVYGTFWLFAGICFVGVIFVAIFLPETKGRSLEEIEAFFSGKSASSNTDVDTEPSPIQF